MILCIHMFSTILLYMNICWPEGYDILAHSGQWPSMMINTIVYKPLQREVVHNRQAVQVSYEFKVSIFIIKEVYYDLC